MSQSNLNPNSDCIDKVSHLMDRVVDAKAGFDTMVEKAEPDFKDIVRMMRDMHHRHATRIATILSDLGQNSANQGTLMSQVNKAVVSMRALVDEIDSDVVGNILSGEQYVMDAFDDVLNDTSLGDLRGEFSSMRQELSDRLDALKSKA